MKTCINCGNCGKYRFRRKKTMIRRDRNFDQPGVKMKNVPAAVERNPPKNNLWEYFLSFNRTRKKLIHPVLGPLPTVTSAIRTGAHQCAPEGHSHSDASAFSDHSGSSARGQGNKPNIWSWQDFRIDCVGESVRPVLHRRYSDRFRSALQDGLAQ